MLYSRPILPKNNSKFKIQNCPRTGIFHLSSFLFDLSSFISRFPWLMIISRLYTPIKFINRIYDVDCYL